MSRFVQHSVSGFVGYHEYPYTRLAASNALRLLSLRAGSYNDPLHCELFIAHLPNAEARYMPYDEFEVSYEAVSWCWGGEVKDHLLRIDQRGQVFVLAISLNLDKGLRALREEHKERILWVDALCINQRDLIERNEQVPKMNLIYSQASCVLIWLGDREEPTNESAGSDKVLDFISSSVLQIWKFDQLWSDLRTAKEWYGFVSLMKRPWFSRRWVVQEIALARRARLHCGSKSINWQDFADAVSLVVEVESASHNLSDVMRRNHQFYNIPEFFGHVPALGAALLVDATNNLFRNPRKGKKIPLLSLEYLVSRYSAFEVSQARDTVYAMLSIAKDSVRRDVETVDLDLASIRTRRTLVKWLREYSKSQAPYRVDYRQSIVEVYREFITFSIHQSGSLDILLRPWAPRIKRKDDQAGLAEDKRGTTSFIKELTSQEDQDGDDSDEEVPLPSWISTLGRAPFSMVDHPIAGLRMERRNADPLVGMPAPAKQNYAASETIAVSMSTHKFRPLKTQYAMEVEGFIIDRISTVEEPARLGNLPDTWLTAAGWTNRKKPPSDEFWRTIVADRSTTGTTPPTFYSRLCREAAQKMTSGNPLNTQQFINEGRDPILGQFLRRVQAVIWNRRLMRSQGNRLGLVHADAGAGDYICVFRGCSVPVTLRKHQITTPDDIRKEQQEQAVGNAGDRLRAAMFIQRAFRALLERRKHREEKLSRQRGSIGQHSTFNAVREEETSSGNHVEDGHINLRQGNTYRHARSNGMVKGPEESKRSEGRSQSDDAQTLVNGSEKAHRQEGALVNGSTLISSRSPPTLPIKPPHLSQRALATSKVNGDATSERRTTSAQQSGVNFDIESQLKESKLKLSSHYWRLIGECYVDGLMDGEAIEWQNIQKAEASYEEIAQGFDGKDITFELR